MLVINPARRVNISIDRSGLVCQISLLIMTFPKSIAASREIFANIFQVFSSVSPRNKPFYRLRFKDNQIEQIGRSRF
jgi:hypothetical protein